MVAVGPALVVVHGNVFHHAGKLVEILRRIDVCAPTPSDSVIDFRATGANGGDHLVGWKKIVALRFFGISAPVRKDDAGIPRLYHSGALCVVGNEPGELSVVENELRIDFRRTHCIVGAYLINTQIFILFDAGLEVLPSPDSADHSVPEMSGSRRLLCWHPLVRIEIPRGVVSWANPATTSIKRQNK